MAGGEYMRLGQVKEWLRGFRLSDYEVRQLISANVIKRVRYRPGARCHYRRSQIQKDILDKSK